MLIIKICYSARLRLYVNLFQSAHRHPLRRKGTTKTAHMQENGCFFGK